MQRNEKIKKIEQSLPYGSKKYIADKTGLSQRTVINFFKLRTVSIATSEKIIKVIKGIVELDNSLMNI